MLEDAIRRWEHCGHKGTDMINNSTQYSGKLWHLNNVRLVRHNVCQENIPTSLNHHQQSEIVASVSCSYGVTQYGLLLLQHVCVKVQKDVFNNWLFQLLFPLFTEKHTLLFQSLQQVVLTTFTCLNALSSYHVIGLLIVVNDLQSTFIPSLRGQMCFYMLI